MSLSRAFNTITDLFQHDGSKVNTNVGGEVYLKFYSMYLSCQSCQERELSENYKMRNACQLWDSNPGSSAYEAKALPLNYDD